MGTQKGTMILTTTHITSTINKQNDKKMDDEMEAGIIGSIGII